MYTKEADEEEDQNQERSEVVLNDSDLKTQAFDALGMVECAS